MVRVLPETLLGQSITKADEKAIIRVREEKAKVIPGYDGVYGQLALFDKEQEDLSPKKPKQKSMADFM